ncbi:hypothetical protein [Amycolatopsis sp. NPDC059657]|uniref:hypothetical protein n=1 Tax=Amycolatopsis sp. NPDC059657 TaxID=3346899 RepID=UPI00366CEBAF
MADLILTDERRRDLLALLDDEQRLKSTYPKLAEYLDMAPGLAGTGNDQADAAFDLRMLHYVTGGAAESSNPYWDIVGPSVTERNGRRIVDGGRVDGSARLAFAETVLQDAYAYAVPSPETLTWIQALCAGRTVVELGAGRGYWAAQLDRLGLVVEAYDIDPPRKGENPSFSANGEGVQAWRAVDGMAEYAARGSVDSESVLFLCWPPGWGNTMASEALRGFAEAGGRRLLFVGEPKGGKTGDDGFFDALSEGWNLESEDVHFVSWWNLSDVGQFWTHP